MFIATCVLGILAVGAIASSPLYARRVASFGSKGLGAAFIALALAVGALSATTHLQSGPFICSFLLLLVGAVLVLAHWDAPDEGNDDRTDGEPPWWPEFEDEFRSYSDRRRPFAPIG